jgi:K+/H+ antiporter YhaU regulatory subunit KhtT
MRLCRPIIQRVSLVCFLLTATGGSSIADDGDKLASTVRTAWEKYSELQDVRAAYAGRSEITGMIHALERERADLVANIREHQTVLDGMPRLRNGASGRNSIQEGYYQELLMLRQQLTEMDRTLEELRFRLREMDEMDLRQGEMTGRRVKSNNRRDLLPEAQRLQKECQSAFTSLKEAADAVAGGSPQSREQVVRQAMAAQSAQGAGGYHLCSSKVFLTAFKQFCAGRTSFGESSHRGSRARSRRAAG